MTRERVDFPRLVNTLDAVGRFLASFNTRARLETERQARARREQRVLANLEAWSKTSPWAARVAALQASRLLPDRSHPAQRECCRKFTRERIK